MVLTKEMRNTGHVWIEEVGFGNADNVSLVSEVVQLVEANST